MEYTELKKNTVSSKGQLEASQFVTFENPAGKGRRIMFAGNSITLHHPKPEIGWHNKWGMAASEKEKDYVHLCMAQIRKIDPDAAFCICQVAEWERNYKNGGEKLALYKAAREFEADVVIARFVENCPHDEFDATVFEKEYAKLLDYLGENAKKIVTTSFWYHPANDFLEKYAEKTGAPFVALSDLGEKDEMKALGLFEHSGVAHHPGDFGMKTIAERIMEVM